MYPDYIREKARGLRTNQRLSIDEIAARLALSRTTVYYWVADLPLGRRSRANPHPGTRKMCAVYRAKREGAYASGRAEFAQLSADPTFRDFVCLYVAEGYKRDRNTVSMCNSDAAVMTLAVHWIRRFSRNVVRFAVQYHADQDLTGVQEFWARHVGAEPHEIALQRKSNSNRLSGRTWRSLHGVLAVRACDTLLRARLEAWMDSLKEEWVSAASRAAAAPRLADIGA